MIKLEYGDSYVNEYVYFHQVEQGQFFISLQGNFCQKCGPKHYNIIADDKGEPWIGLSYKTGETAHIKKILPRVNKITWEDE